MNILAIDTSANHLTVILLKGDKVFGESLKDCGLQHSVTLMPLIEKTLIEGGVKISEIDVFACVNGPGSFTGIRIGVSTVKAFAHAFSKKVLSLTSFDLIAYNKKGEKVLALIDAKHDNYYAQLYSGVQPIGSPVFSSYSELLKYKGEYEFVNFFDCDLKGGLISAVNDNLDKATFDIESLIPLYVRKSQAEESL